MWSDIKNYIVGFLVRWIMKIGGGFLLAHGISQNSVNEIVGAIVGILFGLIISLFQHKKAVDEYPIKPKLYNRDKNKKTL